MIKSKMTAITPAPTDLKFPLLARYITHSDSDRVVLFTSNKTGVVVHDSSQPGSIGEYLDDGWTSITNSKTWRILNGDESITLSNS